MTSHPTLDADVLELIDQPTTEELLAKAANLANDLNEIINELFWHHDTGVEVRINNDSSCPNVVLLHIITDNA